MDAQKNGNRPDGSESSDVRSAADFVKADASPYVAGESTFDLSCCSSTSNEAELSTAKLSGSFLSAAGECQLVGGAAAGVAVERGVAKKEGVDFSGDSNAAFSPAHRYVPPSSNVYSSHLALGYADSDPGAAQSLSAAYESQQSFSLTPSGHLPFPDGSGNIPQLAIHGYGVPTQGLPPSMAQAYPTVYVSPGGLITVLLKYDIAVELTVDKTIRVVNHRHKAVAASNARGSTNCIFHVAAKVFQDGTKTEAEVFGERRCRMTTDGILFSSGVESYLLDDDHIVPAMYCFSDMSKDCSINILFASSCGPSLTAQCEEIAKTARYYFHKNGSTTVILNNVKIHQDERGDVQVTSGPKYIFTSPVNGNLLLQSHFVEMSVQVNWCASVKRGDHLLQANYTSFTVSNGKHEAGFDQYREVFSRPFREVASEFNSWIPSLALLPQLLPAKPQANRETKNRPRFDRSRSNSHSVSSENVTA